MKKKKSFDCVQMKWEIQQEMLKEFSGVSEKERYDIMMKRIKENPILSKFAQRISVA